MIGLAAHFVETFFDILAGVGLEAMVVLIPGSMDPDEFLDRYGSDAFTVAIVEMLRSGELPVTWEQAGMLWERGGKTS